MDHTTAPTQGLLESAHVYIDNQWPVLPLYPLRDGECACPESYKTAKRCKPGKHPIGDLVPNAHQDATLDKAVATTWWTLWPDANIGIALGLAGLIDVAPDSVEWWAEFHARGLPPTAHFISGGGEGHGHWLYQRGDLPSLRIARRGRFDILSDGYAVMPPSRHASGQWYRWEGDSPTTPFPEWLGEVVRRYEAARSERVGEAVTPRDTDEPPVALTANQLDVWNGQVEADDRSGGLVELARMLATAGYQDADGIASILAERDLTLGWEKYANRKDASQRYREIAERYGRREVKISLSKGKTSSAPTSSAPREKNGSTTGLLVAHSIAEERERPQEEVTWFIEGWLGKGMMTELVAKVKLGKTTWALQGLRAFMVGDESFCGQAITRAGKVLYVTEEGRATFHEALQRYGLWDLNDEMLIVYDFEMIDMKLDVAVGEMIRLAEENSVDVVVIDTLTTVAGLDDEDNSGRVGAAMREFRRIANAGYAVWTLRHGRKIGGEVGDAGRGSSAISGAVDILLQIDPFKGDDDESNLRIMRARGRMKATPTDKLTLEFDKDTERYRLVGQTVSREERLNVAILDGLEALEAFDKEHGKTSNEVTLKIGKRLDSVRKELKSMAEDGRVRDGARSTVTGGTPAKIFWLPPVVRLHPDHSDQPEPVVVEPESSPRVTRARAPKGPTPESATSSAPEEVLRSTGGGSTTGQKREKTPAAVAKAVEQKALRELERLEAADAAAPTLEYYTALTDAELVNDLGMLKLQSVALDTETTGLSAKRDKLRTINLSDGETHIVIDAWSITDWSPLQRYLDDVLEVRMHTYLFDLAFLQSVGLTIDAAKIYDVRTAAMVLESREDWTDYRLQGIAKRHLAQHVDKKEQRGGWDVPVLRHAKLAYAAEDARVTHAAGAELAARLAQDVDVDGLWHVLALERDVQAATWWLASAGAPADAGVMRQAVAEQETTLAELLVTLNAAAGAVDGAVNWRSPKQVLPLLVDHGLDVTSTSEGALMDTLEATEAPDPLIRALLDYRSAGACLGLLRKAQSSIAPDGRIYASFNPIGAQTGRTSCSDPNLQNLPHHTRAREAIRPGPGKVFVRADYSQLQIVIAAWIAQDQEMIRILNLPKGESDIHQRTADAVGCTRKEAKAVNFGFLFGAGAETFQREQRKNGVYLTDRQSWRYRDTFLRTYRGIRDWHRKLSDWGVEETIIDPSGSGRRRTAVFSKNIKANTPVQMTEAYGFKRAMQGLYATRHEVPSARLVMMVHDELIAECDEQDAEQVGRWLIREMVLGMQPLVEGVAVRVDATIVVSYSDDDKERGQDIV